MEQRKLGQQGAFVSAIGFGCMSLGIGNAYSSSVHNEADAVALIHRALELGVNFLDTANVYGDSELKVGKALKGCRDKVVLATKFGIVGAIQTRGVDGCPENARQCCDLSLQRLGVEHIDLYYLHRVDPQVPIEETVGAMAELVRSGKVRHLGLSEAAPQTIRRAHKIHPIAALQTEYSLWSREPEQEIIPTLRELGTSLVAYSPLGRGFLGGRFRKMDDLRADDWRRTGSPRFEDRNFAKNMSLLAGLESIAKTKGCTPAQLALAWLLAKNPEVVPIPGTSNPQRLEENVAAAKVQLSPAEMDQLEAAVPSESVAGERYSPQLMSLADR